MESPFGIPYPFEPERYRTPSNLRNRVACYVSYVARRLPGHDAVRGEAIEVRIADVSVRAFPDESIAAVPAFEIAANCDGTARFSKPWPARPTLRTSVVAGAPVI